MIEILPAPNTYRFEGAGGEGWVYIAKECLIIWRWKDNYKLEFVQTSDVPPERV
jgi:hypothetical protein